MASSLPDNPSLDRLRADARRLQRGIVAADAAGRHRPRPRHHPRLSRAAAALANAPPRFALHDAQLTVARRYGFTGWPALVHYLEVAAELTVDPTPSTRTRSTRPTGSARWVAALRRDRRPAPRQAAADLLRPIPASSSGTCGRLPRRPTRARIGP